MTAEIDKKVPPDLVELDYELQCTALREKLWKLENARADARGEARAVAGLSKDPPRVSIGLTHEEHKEFQELARRCSTSISALGQLAIKHLMLQSRAGALPMLPPSRVETAILVGYDGEPYPVLSSDD